MAKIVLEEYHRFTEGQYDPNCFVVDEHGTIYLIVDHGISKVSGKCCEIYAGSSFCSGDMIGFRLNARFWNPSGLTYDHRRQLLYVLDKDNHKIKKISTKEELVSNFIGHKTGFADDESTLFTPTSVILDKHGNLFVLDMGNSYVRKIAPEGTMIKVYNVPSPSARCLAINPFNGQIFTVFHNNIVALQVVSNAGQQFSPIQYRPRLLWRRFSRHHQVAFGLKSKLLVSISSSFERRKCFEAGDWSLVVNPQPMAVEEKPIPFKSPIAFFHMEYGVNGRISPLRVFNSRGEVMEAENIQNMFQGIKSIEKQTCTTDKWGNIYFMAPSCIYQLRDTVSWRVARLMWIGCMKEDASYCPLALLPRDIVRELIPLLH